MSQLPVPQNPPAHPIVPASVPILERPQPGRIWTTLPTSTHSERVRAANLAQGQGMPAEEAAGKILAIQHLLLKGITLQVPETGEVADCVMALLIPPEGQAVQCISWGVISSLETIVAIMGPPPWHPPIRARLEQYRTRRKYMSYRLAVLDDTVTE